MDSTQRKEITLIVTASLYSLLFFLTLAFAYQGQTQTLSLPLITAVLGLLWVAFIAIAMAFVLHQPLLQWALLILPSLMALVSSGFAAVAFIGSLLLFLSLLAAQRSIRTEIENSIKLKTLSVFRPGVRLVLLGLAAMALTLALPVIKNQAQAGQIVLPPDTATSFVQAATPLISQYIPNYQVSMTVDQIIQNQLNQQQVPAGFTLAPDQLRLSRQALGQRLNLELTGNETIPVIISQIFNRYIRNLAQGDGLIVTLLLVLLALIAIRAIIPLLIWPILFLISGLLWGAHRLNIIKKIPTPVTIERYQL